MEGSMDNIRLVTANIKEIALVWRCLFGETEMEYE